MTDQTSGIAQDIEIPTCNTCGSPRDWRRHIVGGNDLYQIHKDDGTLAGYGCERTTQAPPDQAEGLREHHGYELQPDPEMAGYCKVKGLVIRTVPEFEGGGHMIWEPQARMIVAGPKMLAALKRFVSVITCDFDAMRAPGELSIRLCDDQPWPCPSCTAEYQAREIIAEVEGAK